ncbi:MAG: hypothetical protein IPN67_18135 [Bacteroidales bacterium]|nr:hypothetical protein [Bacteroidales bacterium]
MKSFLKYTLAAITGIILTSIIFVVLLASLSALVASGDKPVSIGRKFYTCP